MSTMPATVAIRDSLFRQPHPAAAVSARPQAYEFALGTGLLTLQLDAAQDAPLGEFLHVASRQNPRRGFLFVSHLLGKHVPVTLPALRRTHAAMASQTLAAMPAAAGPVLVVGMAETATLLGYGVWRELARALLARDGVSQCLFMQTTRYRTGGPAWSFEESHSHAPQQWLHGLADPRLAATRHVVLVDDELSTGHTFEALEAVLRARLPHLESVQWACLTDFRPAEHRHHPAHALLRGAWSFASNGTAVSSPAIAANRVAPALLQCDHGRARPLSLAARASAASRMAVRAALLDATRAARGRVLVVGTGEFMPMPFELAEELEKRPTVTAVSFQATTRSPADMPAIALGPDHYGEGVPQFIYNYDRAAFDSVLVVTETPPSDISRDMARRLDASLVSLAPT